MTKGLKALSQLFGSYLHQDWAEEFDTEMDAVRTMVGSEPKEALAAASSEIRGLLSADLSEADLANVMTGEVGCYFDPGSKGQTYHEWLGEVLDQLEMKAT